MQYRVYETDHFTKIYNSMEKSEQEWIVKMKNQRALNGYLGKPLGFTWFREKKYRNKRLYYFVRNDKVLLVSFGVKKNQQSMIDRIMSDKNRYFDLLNQL